MGRLYFVHRLDDNVGDILSGPSRYWDWGPHAVVDICDTAAIQAIEPGSRLVIGGGGLLMPWFDPHRERLLARSPAKVAWWGVGERRIQDVAGGYVPAEAAAGIAPGEFPASHLVGLRSLEPGYRHVPCASCKFVDGFVRQRGWTEGAGTAVFEHVAVPLARDLDHPRMTNVGCRPEDALSFIAGCRVLVTNSYHGMYWGCLLAKRVICVPFSSGLYRHPWRVDYVRPAEVAARVDAALASDPGTEPADRLPLATAVAANDAFRDAVFAHLNAP